MLNQNAAAAATPTHEERTAAARESRLQAAYDMANNIISGWQKLDGRPDYEGAPAGAQATEIELAGGRLVLMAFPLDNGRFRSEVQIENADGEIVHDRRSTIDHTTFAEAKIFATAIAGLWRTEIELKIVKMF